MRTDTNPVRIMPADYSPDMPALDNPGSANILNCLPRTPDSYGPFASISAFATALPISCLGAFAAEDSGGNNLVFAGTMTDLYKYTGSSPANVSKSPSSYSVASGERWRFLQFGNRVIATDFIDAMQSYVMGTSANFADLANGGINSLTLTAGTGYTNGTYALTVSNPGIGTGFAGTVTVSSGQLSSYNITSSGSNYPQTAMISVPAGAGSGTGGAIAPVIATIAPKARYMAAVRGFMVVCNTYDNTSGNNPQRVWWSSLNDPTYWPTPGTNAAAQYQSSYNDLTGDGGWIQGIVGGLSGVDGAIFLERQVYIMSYAGPPATWTFYPAEGVRGTSAPKSIIQVGGIVYYLGVDGFYSFDGTNSTPIGANKVDKTFYSMLDQNNTHRIDGAFDAINKIVYWAFPSTSAINGTPDTIIAYNWQLQKWALISQTTETLLNSFTFGYTLDTLPGQLDSYNVPLDSRQFTGGNQILTGFTNTHQMAYFNGPNLAATIETGEKQAFLGRMAFINNTRPLVDGGLPTVAIAARNRTIDAPVYGSATAINAIGTCPLRANGRYLRAIIQIPASSTWNHCQGVEVEGRPNGVM